MQYLSSLLKFCVVKRTSFKSSFSVSFSNMSCWNQSCDTQEPIAFGIHWCQTWPDRSKKAGFKFNTRSQLHLYLFNNDKHVFGVNNCQWHILYISHHTLSIFLTGHYIFSLYGKKAAWTSFRFPPFVSHAKEKGGVKMDLWY